MTCLLLLNAIKKPVITTMRKRNDEGRVE